MRVNMLWVMTGLVISIVRHALQYGRLPWAAGWIEFAASWFIHTLAVFGVAGIVYITWENSLQPFFAKDKLNVQLEPGPIDWSKRLHETLQQQRIRETLALVSDSPQRNAGDWVFRTHRSARRRIQRGVLEDSFMAPQRLSHRRYRCRFCGAVLPAWLPVAQAVDGAMLLGHLGQQHPNQVGAYLDRMRHDEDIALMAAEAFEVVEAEG